MANAPAMNLALALFGLVHGPGVIDTGEVVEGFAEGFERFFADFDSNFYEVPDREWAEQRVDQVIRDLESRQGLQHEWLGIERDIRDEIREAWITILSPSPSSRVREDGRG